MSGQPPRLCAAVRSKSSSYLDGRMPADGRRAVQQHLNSCPECLRELQAIAKLSRATHNLPQHRMPSDMASRVKQRMATHRQEAIANLKTRRWRSHIVIAAAAAVLVATSWTAGFWMGHASQPAEVAEQSPVTPLLLRAKPLATESFRSASHNVLQDLAVAPSLPEHAQRPLIAAQLAYFDLPERARPILANTAPDSFEHRLAGFVTELDTAITSPTPIDWGQWHQRAEQRGLLTPRLVSQVPIADASPNERAQTIVDRFPKQLDVAERASLAEFLVLKHELLSGKVTTSLSLIEQWQTRPDQASTFAIASGTASTRTLIDAGRSDDARRMFRAMRTHVGARVLSVTTSGEQHEALRNHAAEMLDRMMRELQIDANPRERKPRERKAPDDRL